MIYIKYASREATKRAIRTVLSKCEDKFITTENNGGINTCLDAPLLPKFNEYAGIHYKNFPNANGAELIYGSNEQIQKLKRR